MQGDVLLSILHTIVGAVIYCQRGADVESFNARFITIYSSVGHQVISDKFNRAANHNTNSQMVTL